MHKTKDSYCLWEKGLEWSRGWEKESLFPLHPLALCEFLDWLIHWLIFTCVIFSITKLNYSFKTYENLLQTSCDRLKISSTTHTHTHNHVLISERFKELKDWLHWCSHKPRNVGSHQNLEEARHWFPLKASRESLAPWHLDSAHWDWLQTSGLNYERINSCCFKPLSLWQFVIAETKT